MTIPTPGRKAGSQSGFSRLELAVVIVVLLMLLALLVPLVLKIAHGKSSKQKCVSNLKQIGLAYHVFANEHAGKYPAQIVTNIAYQDETRTWVHFQAMAAELSTPRILACTQDAERRRAGAANFNVGKAANAQSLSILRNAAVSYFVTPMPDETTPRALLAGDRSLAIAKDKPGYSSHGAKEAVTVSLASEWSLVAGSNLHGEAGNTLLSDGSVEMNGYDRIQKHLRETAANYGTNINRFVFPQ